MCSVKAIIRFVKDGVSTFRDAAAGRYCVESDEVKSIRSEMFDSVSSPSDDKKKLREDRRNVGRDCRTAFNGIALHHG